MSKNKISEESIGKAREILQILAPHVPLHLANDSLAIETSINYAYDQAQILKNELECIKNGT